MSWQACVTRGIPADQRDEVVLDLKVLPLHVVADLLCQQ